MKIVIRTILFINQLLPKQEKRRALVISFLLLINSGLELLGLGAILPLLLVLLEDNIIEKYEWAAWVYNILNLSNEKQFITILACGFLFIVILKNMLSLWILKVQSAFSYSLFKKYTLEIHRYFYDKGFSFFKSTNSNVVVRDARTASERFAQALVLGTLNFLNEIIILILIIAGIALYNYKILLLLLVTVIPAFLLFYSYVRKRAIKLGEIRNRIEPIIGINIFQSIFGFVDIIISGSEKKFRSKIADNVDELVDVNVKTNVYNSAPTKVIETSLMLAICVMVLYGIYYLPSKNDLIKLLGLFILAGYRIMPSINRMMIAINGLNLNVWVFDILSPLVNKEYKEQLATVKNEKLSFRKELILENINFAYPNTSENTIENYSLRIKKGEVIGLVGESGSGKTTLMNILLGFLEPTKGVYKIDDQILSKANKASFYKKIGYVQQQVYLIDATFAENIAFGYGIGEIDLNKLERVLKQASLWQLVKELPEGIHSMIGENGAKLSGGQRQRVGIARALYFDAEILFFDEATSALDDKTEKEISESINKLSDGNLTMIIIAHRLSTLEGCDRIIEVKKQKTDNTRHGEF